jgi:hypothetical protein
VAVATRVGSVNGVANAEATGDAFATGDAAPGEAATGDPTAGEAPIAGNRSTVGMADAMGATVEPTVAETVGPAGSAEALATAEALAIAATPGFGGGSCPARPVCPGAATPLLGHRVLSPPTSRKLKNTPIATSRLSGGRSGSDSDFDRL